MENIRATKRRKLDTPEKGHSKSSPAQGSTKTPDVSPKQNGARTREAAGVHGARSASASHSTWTEAKAKAQERRGKRVAGTPQKERNVDVYDDIEGAHSGRSRLKSLANSAPKTKQLDPLRNQTAASPAKSSPSKAGGRDFFKQFAKPKSEDETTKKDAEGHVIDGVNEGKHHPGNSTLRDEKMINADQSAPEMHSGKGAWKNWAYAEKSKKTFEDEIRDLEKAAKEKAEHEGEEIAADRSLMKRRARQSTTPAAATQQAEEVPKARFAPITTPKTVKTAGRPEKQFDDRETSTKREKERKQAETENVDNELEQQLQAEIGSAPPTSTPFKQKLQQPSKKPAKALADVIFEAQHLELIKTIILGQLTSRRPTRLTNLDDEYAKVANVVSQAVTAGESNSMLLIGSRGSGKTTLINQILRKQAIDHPDDFHVVRLNGFIHTDDKIALREIWRQLGREMDLDKEESNLKNYADTLTSLLALLSHPAEQGREQQQGQVTKSVIFILDEFELFASHPRQTLLYNLFDIAQSRKAPITVLGLTTRIDVAESLEKRVKSRFSHRYVHLSSAKSFPAFQAACTAALTINTEDLSVDEQKALGGSSTKTASKAAGTVLDDWSSLIDTFLSQEDTIAHLHHIYYTTKSVPEFHASVLSAFPALTTTSEDDSIPASSLLENLAPTPALSLPDSKLALLSSLSTLHLALLICAARLTAIHAQDVVPFVQAYEEYKSIASKAKIQASASGALAQGAGGRVWGKEVCRDVWSELVGMGLVMEDGGRGGRVDVGLEEIGACGVELGAWGRWCREI